MYSKIKCSLWIISIIVSTFFMACSKDDEPEIIDDEIEVNHPIYVSEAVQGDYKNTYSYEKVDGKIRLKQIDLFKLGVKKYDLKLRYDVQNRLIECKRSVSTTEYNYHENKILNEFLPSDYSIQYTTNKLTVIDNDDADNTKIYDLGKDGCVKEVRWNIEGKLHVMTFDRLGNDFVSCELISSIGSLPFKNTYLFTHDDKNSIDYLRVMLPCLYSDHNVLRTTKIVDNQEESKITYAYEYRSLNFPVTILKNTINLNGIEEESHRSTMILKYINAENI